MPGRISFNIFGKQPEGFMSKKEQVQIIRTPDTEIKVVSRKGEQDVITILSRGRVCFDTGTLDQDMDIEEFDLQKMKEEGHFKPVAEETVERWTSEDVAKWNKVVTEYMAAAAKETVERWTSEDVAKWNKVVTEYMAAAAKETGGVMQHEAKQEETPPAKESKQPGATPPVLTNVEQLEPVEEPVTDSTEVVEVEEATTPAEAV